MKKKNILKISMALAVLLTLTACSKKPEENRTIIKEPGKSITVIDSEDKDEEVPIVTVEKIDKYDGIEISDWYDEQTVVLAKENPELEKMSLLENAEFYPRSIYLYNLETKEYQTLKAQKNMFLGGAVLSPDKKHLLYYEYSIGDTAHYLMAMDEDEQTPVKEGVLGSALTAQWADADTVIGASYAGGAYMADMSRNITKVADLEEQLYTVNKHQDKIYYITFDGPDLQLYVLDLMTKEIKNLNIANTVRITPSPDGEKLLITQGTGSTRTLLVADADGNILRTIAEGTEVTGASWSPDQQMIAYQLSSVINGVESSGLYLYDVLSGKSIQIAVNIGVANIRWSPSGKKIAVSEMGEKRYNSSIIYLNDVSESQTQNMGYIMAIDTAKKAIAIDWAELLFSTDEERLSELNINSDDLVTGFYIYNEEENVEFINYDDNLKIELLNDTIKSEVSLKELEERLLQHEVLFNLTLKDNIIVEISEQYTP